MRCLMLFRFHARPTLIALGLWLLVITLAAPHMPAVAQDAPDPVVSTVNGEQIPREWFHNRVKLVRWQYLKELQTVYAATGGNFALTPNYVNTTVYNLENPAILGDAVLYEMEEERLLWQTGQSLGIVPTAEDAQLREDAFFSGWTSVPVANLATNADAQAFIADWYAGATAASGMSAYDIRILFETEALRGLLFEYVSASVPTQELAVNTRHILCSFHPENPGDLTPPTQEEYDAAKTCIQSAQIRLASDEDFATVAADLSADQASAVQGGAVGWTLLSYLAPAYADATRAAELNTLLGPVETEFGLHLIEVLEREMQLLTEEQLSESQQGYFQLWVSTLWGEATVTRAADWDLNLPTEPTLQTLDPAILEAIATVTDQ